MAYRRTVGLGNGSMLGPVATQYSAADSCDTGLGCACGGQCSGLGLFDAGMDFTTWSWPEWGIVGVAVYALLSFVGDTKRGVERTRRVSRAVRKAV